ncbi:MAG: hypothetical protein QF926_00310 [Alphaproteobacteria bacterium]|jgi:TPR repeat protein|nr:hypothetical protein [Alphaproteobacteria bacterium]
MRNVVKAALVVTVLSVASAMSLVAGPWEEAEAAYNRGDYETAFRLLRPLAEQGDADAQLSLGFSYATGQGASQDYVQAHKWFALAASRPSASGKVFRDIAVKHRDLVAARMTPAQIAEAQRLAREWQEEHQ